MHGRVQRLFFCDVVVEGSNPKRNAGEPLGNRRIAAPSGATKDEDRSQTDR
jgi:hypothetical protein